MTEQVIAFIGYRGPNDLIAVSCEPTADLAQLTYLAGARVFLGRHGDVMKPRGGEFSAAPRRGEVAPAPAARLAVDAGAFQVKHHAARDLPEPRREFSWHGVGAPYRTILRALDPANFVLDWSDGGLRLDSKPREVVFAAGKRTAPAKVLYGTAVGTSADSVELYLVGGSAGLATRQLVREVRVKYGRIKVSAHDMYGFVHLDERGGRLVASKMDGYAVQPDVRRDVDVDQRAGTLRFG
ncbi:hypothetical protein [Actinokineospora sp. NBRC 105648]|uniref:hypothetical protein n=1 Tax=Actinokineospora sp. NBRC 105648 TaxID=3032206 RepID=UPI00249FB38C|nr:hypothetical protein [Actinokineospora sp. NBRC 105648]GLZ40112.1 hypothetical protein Acsp05_37360 [Actinokineospora sp. NBRC 105648]